MKIKAMCILKEKVARALGKSANYYRSIGITIGDNFSNGSHIEWGTEPYLIQIGDNVKITDNVRFITHDGGIHVLRNMFSNMARADVFGKIIIGNNVFVGNNAILLPSVSIGSNVIIGAGSIVTHNIPDNTVAAGIPCRVISTIEEYYSKKVPNVIQTKGMNCNEKRDYLMNSSNLLS